MDCHDDLHEGTLGPDCAQCHTPKSWIVLNISDIHRRSRFPLTGAHQLTDCSACHKSASARRFDPLGTECADCHRNTYLSTTNPNHQADGFSTECLDCHTTNPGWKPARFAEHDAKFFPVYSGNHANTWNSCSDCHKQVNNYAVFTCIDCHEHSREEMDDEHKDENDYRYNSAACLSCHPRGN